MGTVNLSSSIIDAVGGDPTAREDIVELAQTTATVVEEAQGYANTALVAAAAAESARDEAQAFNRRPLVSGQWRNFTGMIRIRMVGTGTVQLDSKNALDVVANSVYTYTISSATNQIEYPYLGADAVSVRAFYTGSATAELI